MSIKLGFGRVDFMGLGFWHGDRISGTAKQPGTQQRQLTYLKHIGAISGSLLIASSSISTMAVAPAQAQFAPYCQQTLEAITEKENLRQAMRKGNRKAEKKYRNLVTDHARHLTACRKQNAFRTQGIWLRLYECDVRPGRIEETLDRIVERGYNEIFVETFYNGMVLLPKADNPTEWQSVLQSRGLEKRDLLAEVIKKGRERGLK
ncbi:hypothetical protein IQ266_15125, partial [filamentous cyanobacterium LEGE 11480]|nr:hypothetical protein [Romeriopsis navalis LEGE 11480]